MVTERLSISSSGKNSSFCFKMVFAIAFGTEASAVNSVVTLAVPPPNGHPTAKSARQITENETGTTDFLRDNWNICSLSRLLSRSIRFKRSLYSRKTTQNTLRGCYHQSEENANLESIHERLTLFLPKNRTTCGGRENVSPSQMYPFGLSGRMLH